jgi:general secretion pathway protein G
MSITTQAGFSLIEILLVVGIIAFLSVLVGVSVIRSKQDVDRKQAITGAQLVASKAQLFFLDTGVLPANIGQLQHATDAVANWKGPYLLPQQDLDPWRQSYALKAPGSHQDLDVSSAGPDRQHDTPDDLGNWMDTRK